MSLATLTRGKVADLTGCNFETIRYYERVGLLPLPQRSKNGYRRYNQDQISRLRFIERSKKLGFSNEVFRELLGITSGTTPQTRSEVKAITENHIGSIRGQIAELQKMETTLSKISSQCDGVTKISMRNFLSAKWSDVYIIYLAHQLIVFEYVDTREYV
ncbi:MAG: MerR family mercuric resistance operon transcriptional regulator [Gammaproteobacteria bacterium]|jgi:MerR family mercuric resistance operon transcriptional regulator